jgi:hypothetical protein
VSYNDITGKLTIANAVNDFAFQWNSEATETFKLLGSPNTDFTAQVSSWTSPVPILLNTNEVVYIQVQEDIKRRFQGESGFQQTFLISSTSLFGEVIRIDGANNPTQSLILKKTRSLNIRFYNKYNQEIFFPDFTLIFRLCNVQLTPD